MSERSWDQVVDVHAGQVHSVRLLRDAPWPGDFLAIRLDARIKAHRYQYDHGHRLLSVESKGLAIVYLDARDAATLRDQITDTLEKGGNNEL